MAEGAAEALLDLQRLTERLRRECPWDREQTAATIVPHTVEESYEVADAALAGDDAKLLDELGDLLFQVYFLALLLEERGAGDLGQVARGVHEKLVRRHPHVFGDAMAGSVDGEAADARPEDRDAFGAAGGWEPDALLGELLVRFPDGASPPGMLAGMQSAGGRSLQAAD